MSNEVQILEWIFQDPTIFLILIPMVTGILAAFATKKMAIGIVTMFMSLVYSGYAEDSLITGIMYIAIVFLALLTANRLYGFIFTDESV